MKSPDERLAPGEQQKQAFRKIRNFLAGRFVGATRDSALMHEVVKCLFCRVRMNGSAPTYRAESPQDEFETARLYRASFVTLRTLLPQVFEQSEELLLDPQSIAYVDGELSQLNLYEPTRDPLGDLYEAFVGTALQNNEGQFFTPQNAIAWLVEAIDPKPDENVIDPACGAGGFLSYVARRMKAAGVDGESVASRLFGIEKDAYLAKLATAHIALATLSQGHIVCGDSLAFITQDSKPMSNDLLGSFDVVLANPPFGARIISANDTTRRGFDLAHKWKLDKSSGRWTKTKDLQTNSAPQILFIERCISLLKPGGRMGIVVPESLISSASHGYVVQYLRDHTDIRAIVGMPEDLFKTSGKGGTHTKTCLIVANRRVQQPTHNEGAAVPIFMAEAEWCGHDSRGREISNDDLPAILSAFQNAITATTPRFGYWVAPATISTNNLAPRYHNPETESDLAQLEKTHDLVRFGDLVSDGAVHLSTGDEVGKLAYGTGDIPFVRTSDLSGWEIKIDPKHGLSEEIYDRFKDRQDVRAGDILMVRDGTYLIGNCAYVTEYDEKIVYQSHLYKIRILRPDILSPFLLLAILSSDTVARQIKAKRVTQDIIDSLGDRILELVLPIPKNADHRADVIRMVESSIRDRVEARELARIAKRLVVAPGTTTIKRTTTKPANGLSHRPRASRSGPKGPKKGPSEGRGSRKAHK